MQSKVESITTRIASDVEVNYTREIYRVIDLKKDFNFISVTEMERLFSKTRATLRNWRKQGMPYVMMPFGESTRIYFDIQEVLNWANQNGKVVMDRSVIDE